MRRSKICSDRRPLFSTNRTLPLACLRGRRLTLEPLEERRLLTAYLVTSLDDVVAADTVVTLREAIQAANTNTAVNEAPAGTPGADTIQFQASLFPGTITLGGTHLAITEDLSITGPGSADLSVDGNALSRVFSVSSGVTVSMSDLTISGGNATGLASLDKYGGGIYNEGTLTLTDVIVSGNTSEWDGGGIYSTGGSVTLSGVEFSNNTARHGGGLFSTGDTLTISTTTFSDNTASSNGGGLYTSSSTGTVDLSTVDFLRNSAGTGGGIYSYSNTLTVSDLTVSDSVSGNGIYSRASTWTVTDATITGNSGNGIYSYDSSSSSSWTVTGACQGL